MKRSIALLPLGLAACVPASRPPAAPPPASPRVAAPAPLPAPAPAADWRDWPLTPGTWSYRRDERGSVAVFGRAGADALVTLRCDSGGRRIYLSVTGQPTTATLRTTSTARQLPLRPTGGAQAYAAALAATDPLLDAMAFSRGRFTVERAGQAPIVAPAYAEVGRVTEDCRG